MEGLANFIDDLLGAARLLSLSLAIGGLAWCAAVLRVVPSAATPELVAARDRALPLMLRGAMAAALLAAAHVAVKGWVVSLAIPRPLMPAFLHTLQLRAGLAHATAAGVLAAAIAWLLREPQRKGRWLAVGLAAAGTLASGAWLTHAASRFDAREALMTLTVLHQAGALVWVGAVAHLLWLWRHRSETGGSSWPLALRRFAPLGLAAVALLLATALPLATHLIGSWQGLVGTAYGALAVAKGVLLAAALLLAATHHWAARGGGEAVWRRAPHTVAAEAVLLTVAVLVAVSLSSQPPATDVRDQQPTVREVVAVFTPRLPVLESPSHAEVMAAKAAERIGHHSAHNASNAWSEFNHNVAGVILMAMVLLGIAARLPGMQWLRPWWAIGFLPMAVFILVRSDPGTWPLGPDGFWESTFGEADVLQHRLGALLTVALGVNEWRVGSGRARDPRLVYLFPALCVVGGMLLLTHSHSAFELKSEFLIEISHTPMGLFAVLAGVARYLELRLDGAAARAAGVASFACLGVVAAVLMFYREGSF